MILWRNLGVCYSELSFFLGCVYFETKLPLQGFYLNKFDQVAKKTTANCTLKYGYSSAQMTKLLLYSLSLQLPRFPSLVKIRTL
jgi:hypothetical protein